MSLQQDLARHVATISGSPKNSRYWESTLPISAMASRNRKLHNPVCMFSSLQPLSLGSYRLISHRSVQKQHIMMHEEVRHETRVTYICILPVYCFDTIAMTYCNGMVTERSVSRLAFFEAYFWLFLILRLERRVYFLIFYVWGASIFLSLLSVILRYIGYPKVPRTGLKKKRFVCISRWFQNLHLRIRKYCGEWEFVQYTNYAIALLSTKVFMKVSETVRAYKTLIASRLLFHFALFLTDLRKHWESTRLFGTDRLCPQSAEFSEFEPILVQKKIFRPPNWIKMGLQCGEANFIP